MRLLRLLVPMVAVALALGASWLLARHGEPPFALELRGSVNVATHAQLYYDRGHGLSEADSVRVSIFPGPVTDWRFPLPAGRFVGFRFDPVDRTGAVTLFAATIRARGKVVQRLELAAFHPAQQVERSVQGGAVLFTATAAADDPQVTVALSSPVLLEDRWTDGFVGGRNGVMITAVAALVVALLLGSAPVRAASRRAREALRRGDPLARLPGSRRGATWVLLLLLLGEVVVFSGRGAHAAAAIYPRWNDQVQYLGETYEAYDFARAHGMLAGCWAALVNPSAQGTLHDLYGMLACLAAGPSRAAVLTINILALAVWQLAFFWAVRRLTRDGWLATAAALLPLLLRWPWLDGPGTMADYRIDHLAMCALGVATACGLLTEGLRHRRFSLLYGAAVGIAVLTRFLTLVYFVAMLAAIVVWIAVQPDRRRRFVNLALAVVVASLLCGPILWLNRTLVFDYYVIGHYVGPESAIRNQHFGVLRSVRYVVGRFAVEHVGLALWAVILGGAGLLQLGRWLAGGSRRWHPLRGWVPMAAITFAAPALVLTAHAQKSFVVLGALAPGFVALAIGLWWPAWERAHRLVRGFVAAATVVVAVGVFLAHESHPMYDADTRQTSARVRDIAALIYHRAQLRSGPTRVGVDWVTDSLDAQVLRVICYEKFHAWPRLEMTLPTGIEAPTSEDVFTRLDRSDYIVVTRFGGAAEWPYDVTLERLRPEILAWCRAQARPVGEYELGNRYVTVFERVR